METEIIVSLEPGGVFGYQRLRPREAAFIALSTRYRGRGITSVREHRVRVCLRHLTLNAIDRSATFASNVHLISTANERILGDRHVSSQLQFSFNTFAFVPFIPLFSAFRALYASH